MRYVSFEGARISVIGVGTWQFGSREWGYGPDYASKTAGAILERALELGVNLVDTAEIYAFGRSERIVGEAIADRREQVFLATKVFPLLPTARVVEWRGRASAQRLGTHSIDLYQVHWPNPVVPMSSTMEGIRRLQETGVVVHAGVSNFSADQWRRAEEALRRPVISNQVSYSLVDRRPERSVLPHAQAAGRIVIAYSPLGQGLLGAAYDRENRPGGIRSTNPLFLPENLDRAQGLITALREIAAAHDASPAQVALAWVISHPNVVAIPGASSVDQLESNVQAAEISLGDDEIRRLDDESSRFRPRTGPGAQLSMLRERLRPSRR